MMPESGDRLRHRRTPIQLTKIRPVTRDVPRSGPHGLDFTRHPNLWTSPADRISLIQLTRIAVTTRTTGGIMGVLFLGSPRIEGQEWLSEDKEMLQLRSDTDFLSAYTLWDTLYGMSKWRACDRS